MISLVFDLQKSLLKLAVILLWAASGLSAEAATETYAIDPAHSSVEFSVRHFLTKVKGRFQKFEGAITVDREAMEKSNVIASMETSSVDTNQAKRDEHLRKADFFDASKYPKMTFQSKSWKKVGDQEYEVAGDLMLHGVIKPATLTVKCLGFTQGMKGAPISAWEVHGKIKRSDFGMTYGGPAVGDEVEIEINIEAKRQ